MASRNTLSLIKSDIDSYVGERVVLKANKGRKKTSVKEGIIERTYPSIFLVRIDGDEVEESARTVSYSYSDVLTKTIELVLCKDNIKI